MKKFFKDLFKSNEISTKDKYGIVVITNDPEKDASLFSKELAAILRYPQISKSYTISVDEAKQIAPEILADIKKLPAYVIIDEGIYHTQTLGTRLKDALICYSNSTEVILFIELLEKHVQEK